MAVPLRLNVFKGETLVASKDFERDIIKIGRLASAHLFVDDDKVSRIHSVIEVSADGSLSIIDMGSVEGTYLNGKKVNKAPVTFGDEIKLGSTLIRLENPAAAAAANLAAAAASAAPAPRAPTSPEVPVAAGLAQAAVASAPTLVTAAPVAPVPAPAQVAAVAPAPVPTPVPVAAPAPVQVAAAAPVAAAVDEPAAEAPVPRVRRVSRSKSSGPLGVGLHFLWGDQRVGEFFISPGRKRSFSVGSAAGVDFVMGDSKLGTPRFEVLRTDGQSFTVLFSGKMTGELTRRGETLDLRAVIESGKASHEGESYALTLEADDFFQVDLGGITLEAHFQPKPKRVVVPFGESVDFTVINIFLVAFFLAALFVISAQSEAAGVNLTDELGGNNALIAKLIVKPPEVQKNKLLEKLNQQKKEQAEKKAARKKDSDVLKQVVQAKDKPAPNQPSKKDQAKALAQKIFGGKGGAAAIFGGGGLGGDLKNAMGNMLGARGGPGLGLPGLRGGGGVSGGGETLGIGGIGTKGRAGGSAGYGSGVGGLGGKASVEVGIDASDATITGSLDKELIRQVINRNKSQIRYCYESQLNRFPNLSGKVAVNFVINTEGKVVSSKVAQSTANNAELEQCLVSRVRTWEFPKPKGGGMVVVTYPFVFRPSGE
jgi:TonB family protein